MKIVIRKGQQMQPTGGHHYPCHGRRFEGESIREVMDNLRDYRLNNTIPLGDIDQEVLTYYYENSPWMVDALPGDPEPPKSDYYTRWRGWVHQLWKKPAKGFITTKEATPRWEICEKCPKNIRLAVDSSAEGSETLRRVFLLRRGKTTPPKLGFCSCHNWDNSIASFLEAPVELSGKLKETAQPADCWVSSSLRESQDRGHL